MMKKKPPQRRVTDLASKKQQPLQTDASIQEAGEKMRELKTETFPVATGDKLVGTVKGKFPERQAARFGHDPTDTTVSAHMSRKKFYVYDHQSAEEARRIMEENGLQHLSVVDGDLHVIGLISLADLA